MGIQGLVEHAVIGTSAGERIVLPVENDEFSWGSDLTYRDVLGWAFQGNGRLQAVAGIQDTELFALTLGARNWTQSTFQWALEQTFTTTASILLPTPVKLSSALATNPIAGLVVDEPMQLTAQSPVTNVRILRQVTAAPTSGEFQVTAGNIVFHADEVGAAISGYRLETKTNPETIGAEFGRSITNLGFQGTLIGPNFDSTVDAIGNYSQSFRLYVPVMQRNTGINVAAGDNATQQGYRMILQPGFPLPFVLYKEA